jgi:ribonuclease HII
MGVHRKGLSSDSIEPVKQAKHVLRGCLEKNRIEAGCDEAGRGCLAGPVTAAAVILPAGFEHPGLNDSKQLTEKQRNHLRTIIEKEARSWAVAMVSPQEIDEINILNASFLAMKLAISQLTVRPDHLLIDGNRFNNTTGIPHTCIIGGDARFMSIAAASILAKTHRDELMETLHETSPQYCWNRNKGYPTRIHRQAIVQYGLTQWHRRSYRLTDQQLLLWA